MAFRAKQVPTGRCYVMVYLRAVARGDMQEYLENLAVAGVEMAPPTCVACVEVDGVMTEAEAIATIKRRAGEVLCRFWKWV